MPSAQRSVHIARPVDEVFAFFTDAANETRWRSAHLKEFRAEGLSRSAPGSARSPRAPRSLCGWTRRSVG
jgi:uncharacterized protein YndB with AHSA1/START domain